MDKDDDDIDKINISMDSCFSNKKINVNEWINRCKNSLIVNI